ncbi:MAG: hypothetical protein AAFY42_03505 [Pseudomonadota bacterium]|jgi:hypothetical protein
MVDHSSLDSSLKLLGSQAFAQQPPDFMDGVWQRAGQLGEIADRRRRAALFSGLFMIGLSAGMGVTGVPYGFGPPPQVVYSDFAAGDQLSPAVLLHVGD